MGTASQHLETPNSLFPDVLSGQISRALCHDAVIGASTWITHPVPPHTTVILEEPKLQMRNGA